MNSFCPCDTMVRNNPTALSDHLNLSSVRFSVINMRAISRGVDQLLFCMSLKIRLLKLLTHLLGTKKNHKIKLSPCNETKYRETICNQSAVISSTLIHIRGMAITHYDVNSHNSGYFCMIRRIQYSSTMYTSVLEKSSQGRR